MTNIFAVGDVHGQYDKLIGLLYRGRLIDARLDWCAGTTTLCFLGDFFDRGPRGFHTMELVRKLQQQAVDAGGQVLALLGNHEVLLLAAQRFGQNALTSYGGTFENAWLRNGGVVEDLSRLEDSHLEWLISLLAVTATESRLLLHADASFYLTYGSSAEEINRNIGAVLRSDDIEAWDKLLELFSQRMAFADERTIERSHRRANPGATRSTQPEDNAKIADSHDTASANRALVEQYLKRFSVQQLIHGHTPIARIIRCAPESVRSALIYADGRCVNVDGGLYLGGPGFVHCVPS